MRPVVGASLRGGFRKFFVNPKMDPQDVTNVVSSTDIDDNISLSSDNESFYTKLGEGTSYSARNVGRILWPCCMLPPWMSSKRSGTGSRPI